MRTVEEDNVNERIANLLEQSKDLSAMVSSWERSFLESVQRQVQGNRRSLSGKQLDIVHRIESKIEKALKGDPDWEKQWDDDKAWCFKIACDYYNAGQPRYYSHVLDWALEHPNKIPPHEWYQKVVENKYAQKIIGALKATPKYVAGSTVMLRSTARRAMSYTDWQNLNNMPLFVIKPTDRATNAARGCRIYALLSSTSAQTVEVEERFIKKWRQPKNPKKANDCDEGIILF